MTKQMKGFAVMDPERIKEIASLGGKASGGNFKNNPTRAVIAGRKGGKLSSGQFTVGCERTKDAARKGGQVSKKREYSENHLFRPE